MPGEPEPTGSITYVYIFAIVAIFLVLIAAMNYMNLATATFIRTGTRGRTAESCRLTAKSSDDAVPFRINHVYSYITDNQHYCVDGSSAEV